MRVSQCAMMLAVALGLNMPSFANEKPTSLDEIIVSEGGNSDIKEKKVGEVQVSSKKLAKQQAADSRDIVRYETGISVVETGRMGASGYAVRGVDENRVGIMVDGLKQSETLSSQGFKELFDGYGNFNNTRNGVEIENVRMATITKGSDSMKAGSGALGGSVLFETKDARDYLIDKDYHIGIKKGYQTMNNQHLTSVTLAGRYKWFDVLFIDTKRKGREIENYFYDIYKNEAEDYSAVGKTREKADPYRITRDSTLLKVAFQPTENHRFSVAVDDSKLISKGEDLSYTLRVHGHSDSERYGERLTHDQSKRKNMQFSYENFNQTPFWDHFKVTYSSQKITNNARTDEYCFKESCIQVENPQGLHLEADGDRYKLVDKYGGELTVKAVTSDWRNTEFSNSKGEVLKGTDFREANFATTLIDCNKLDCSKKFPVYVKKNTKYEDVYAFEDRALVVKTLPNGQKYGELETRVEEIEKRYSWAPHLPPRIVKQYEEASILLPFSAGYARDDYNDRDLNTNTKQLNLDFDKQFSLWKTEHHLKYGGLYSKTEKSMVNRDGYKGGNVKWWAENFFCGLPISGTYPPEYKPAPENYPAKDCTGKLRENTKGLYSYLIPVKTKEQAWYIGDSIQFTNWLNLDLNYRYDKVTHVPEYNTNVPIPKGMIAGIFIPLPDNSYGENAVCGYNTDCMNNNFAQNLALMLQNRSYKHHSYNIGVNLDPTDWLRVQLKYSNGFRAPTSDEIFMTFKHPSFSIAPNVNLKPEVAKTKEVALTLYKNRSFLTLSAFQTNYDNFIDLVYVGSRPVDEGSVLNYPFYQNINLDHAKVTGFEVNSYLDLEDISDKLRGFHFGYKLTHQKGRMNGNIPMNAIQPTTMIFNLGYATQDDKYGIDFYITDVAEKKRSDTYNMYWKDQRDSNKLVQGKPVTDSTLAYRNGHYTIIDAIAYARPIKNLTLSFGVYNLTDQKYITWDSARSIRAIGTMNLIDQDTGAGIKRFYAPGRNFRLSAELTF